MSKTYNKVELLILLSNKKNKEERISTVRKIWNNLTFEQKEKLKLGYGISS